MPGTTLKSFYPNQLEFVVDCYADTIKKLHTKNLTDHHSFRHINDWLVSIDQVQSEQISKHLLRKAKSLKKILLTSPSQQFFLHGDLHHDNILQHGNDWLVIDPKGIVGELEFEVAAFDVIHKDELNANHPIKSIFNQRINLLASKLNMNSQRLSDWIFVRLILSAAWSIEDNDDPTWALKLAEIISH